MSMRPTINAAAELGRLAHQLGPPTWARKYPDEWTPAERAAFDAGGYEPSTFFDWIVWGWGEDTCGPEAS
jgi:hypothetical protein